MIVPMCYDRLVGRNIKTVETDNVADCNKRLFIYYKVYCKGESLGVSKDAWMREVDMYVSRSVCQKCV